MATSDINPIELYHFRDKQQHEVDIIVEQADSTIWGVEVKASSTVKLEDFRNLIKLAEFLGPSFTGGVVFYSGKDILPFNQKGIQLHALPIGLFF